MATSKTKKISLLEQMDVKRSKTLKKFDGGGPLVGKMDDSDFGTNPRAQGSNAGNYANVAVNLAKMMGGNQGNQAPIAGGPPVRSNTSPLSGVAEAAAAGSIAGPWGMAATGAAQFVSNIFQAKDADKKYLSDTNSYRDETARNTNANSIYNSAQGYNQYQDGGQVKKKRWILSENNSNNYNYAASQGSEGGGAGSGYADGGTLAKINDMGVKAPSLMHWMKPSPLPGHMAEGGPMYWMQNIMQNNKPSSYTDKYKKMSPNTAEGGVSRAEKGGAAMFAEGGRVSEKSKLTAPQGTFVDEYIDNLPHEGQVEYERGGAVSHKFGVVPGNGNPRADDKTLMAEQGGFVVPNDKLQKGKNLLAMAGHNPNTKLAMSKGGEAPIKISSKELYMSPEVKEEVQEAAGMDDEDMERELSPNSPYNKHHNSHANGGRVKPSSTSMRQNIDEHQRKTYPGGGNMGYYDGGKVNPFDTVEDVNKNYKTSYDTKFKPGMSLLDPNSNFAKTKNPYTEPKPISQSGDWSPSTAASMAPSKMEEELRPYPETNPYQDTEDANKALTIGGELLNAGSFFWNASQKYKDNPAFPTLDSNVYERNFEAERGSMNRAVDKASATGYYNARNQNQTADTNVGLAANEADARIKVSETIGDKIENERVRVNEIKSSRNNQQILGKYGADVANAEGNRTFTAQKGQAISENIGQAYQIGANYVNNKIGIDGIKSAEHAGATNSMAMADYQSGDPAKVKRASQYFLSKGIDIKSYLNVVSKNVGKDTNPQNSGG